MQNQETKTERKLQKVRINDETQNLHRSQKGRQSLDLPSVLPLFRDNLHNSQWCRLTAIKSIQELVSSQEVSKNQKTEGNG